jgi:hypothetical protein
MPQFSAHFSRFSRSFCIGGNILEQVDSNLYLGLQIQMYQKTSNGVHTYRTSQRRPTQPEIYNIVQWNRFSRSFCILLWSFWLLISQYNKQSSAKSLTDDLTVSGRSFMWQRNTINMSLFLKIWTRKYVSMRNLTSAKLGHEIQCHKMLYHVNKEKDPHIWSTWREHIRTSRLKSISWTPNTNVSEDLKWSTHISNITKKANSTRNLQHSLLWIFSNFSMSFFW